MALQTKLNSVDKSDRLISARFPHIMKLDGNSGNLQRLTEQPFDLPPGQQLDVSEQGKLQAAFEFFNTMSQQLTDAYRGLELNVQQLTRELEQAEVRHRREVADKERVTGRLEDLLHLLPVGVVVLDVRGRIQDCNSAAIDLLGEPLLGERWLDILQRSFSPRIDDGHEVSLHDGRRVSISTRSLEVERGQLIVLTDMTETRALQERLSRHQRLSALGKMVASLAHQIRTPLSAAILYGEHLTNPDLESDQQHRFSVKLMSRLNHLEQQVRDMLIFAKGDMPLSDITTTQALVSEIEAAMESPLQASNSCAVINNGAEGISLQCNTDALVGAVLNLVNNAIQAVGKEARIKINLAETTDGHISISVADQGPGINNRVKANVTEPFFTTKSHGTGLGLAVVQAIVRAHQGEFSITSDNGKGTQVTLKLPARGERV